MATRMGTRGEMGETMNIDNYQKLAARTRVIRGYTEDLTHSSMGVVGEFGELINKIKKLVYHKHENIVPEIIEELGDCLWYIADIATTLGVDLSFVTEQNIEKLCRRYPDGFSVDASINRDDGPASLNEVANEHVIERGLNLHIWQSEESGQYSADDAGEWVRV